MLPTRRLTDRVMILTASRGDKDDHGNRPLVWIAGDPIPGLFQQQSSTELMDDRDVVTTRGVLFLAAGAPLTGMSRVQLASRPGATWRVVGDPEVLVVLGGRRSHMQVVLELVTS